MKKPREFNGAHAAAKQSLAGASRQDAYASDYAGLKGLNGTDRHVRGDDPLNASSRSVNSKLAQPRYNNS